MALKYKQFKLNGFTVWGYVEDDYYPSSNPSGFITGASGLIREYPVINGSMFVTGYIGVSGIESANYSTKRLQIWSSGGAIISDAVRLIAGAAQTETFLVLGSEANSNNNLAHFDNNKNTSRAGMIVSNSASAWNNNFVQLMVHGSSYATNNYLSQSNAGLSMILAQGSETNKFAIGVYDNKHLCLFTNNTERMIIDTNGKTHFNTDVRVTGSLLVSGMHSMTIRNKTVTGNYTVAWADDTILVSGVAPNTITLPSASSVSGRLFRFKKVDNNGFATMISGTTNIDGTTGISLFPQYTSKTIMSDGNFFYTY